MFPSYTYSTNPLYPSQSLQTRPPLCCPCNQKGKASTISSFVYTPSNMTSFLDILTYRTLGIGKVSVFFVPETTSKRGLLTCSVSKTSQKRRYWLDICLFCLKTGYQCGFMNTHIITQIATKENPRLLYQYFVRITLLLFKTGFSDSNTSF